MCQIYAIMLYPAGINATFNMLCLPPRTCELYRFSNIYLLPLNEYLTLVRLRIPHMKHTTCSNQFPIKALTQSPLPKAPHYSFNTVTQVIYLYRTLPVSSAFTISSMFSLFLTIFFLSLNFSPTITALFPLMRAVYSSRIS